MEVVIVNSFETYENRVDMIMDYFKGKGHNVTVIQSDFKHFKKEKRIEQKPDYIFVKTKIYKRNLSFKRMYSHYNFAKKAFEFVENINPDIMYVMLPPNSMAKFANSYKLKNKNVKLYLDIIDLWPETLPVSKIKDTIPVSFWKKMRDNNLKNADYIITECDLYQEVLQSHIKNLSMETLYMAKAINQSINRTFRFDKNNINICYLGSINNIIDINLIINILRSINNNKPVLFHIIGNGENKEQLLKQLKKNNISYIYHGEIYDPIEKQRIFNKCSFGLNIMKKTVCVGLTMKSIDYIEAGLPIINNIQADSTELVNDFEIGYNIIDDNLDEIAYEIAELKEEELLKLRNNTSKVYKEKFSVEAFNSKLSFITNI